MFFKALRSSKCSRNWRKTCKRDKRGKVWLIGEKGVGMEYLKRPRSNALLRGPDCREKRPIQWLLAMFALSFSITLSSEKLAAFCRGG
jgi:hypothetical protein